MAVTKKKAARGRPTKYSAMWCEKAEAYFASPTAYGDKLATKAGLACILGVGRDCLYDQIKNHKDFSDTIRRGEVHQERQLVNIMLDKDRHTTGAIFVAKNILGWTDKQEIHQEVVNTTVNIVKDADSDDL
jgi:hypothetical protein